MRSCWIAARTGLKTDAARFPMAIPVLVLLAFMLPLRLGFTDDGFIHLQYAKNLIQHGEFAFNVGERSFGTTSPLWVMALAAIGARLSDPETWST